MEAYRAGPKMDVLRHELRWPDRKPFKGKRRGAGSGDEGCVGVGSKGPLPPSERPRRPLPEEAQARPLRRIRRSEPSAGPPHLCPRRRGRGRRRARPEGVGGQRLGRGRRALVRDPFDGDRGVVLQSGDEGAQIEALRDPSHVADDCRDAEYAVLLLRRSEARNQGICQRWCAPHDTPRARWPRRPRLPRPPMLRMTLTWLTVHHVSRKAEPAAPGAVGHHGAVGPHPKRRAV